MIRYARSFLTLASIVVATGTTRPTVAAEFLGLGDLAGGSFFSYAQGISANGSVVVGSGTTAASGTEAYRWTSGGGMVGLGDLLGGAFSSYARGVSADGSVVVGSGTSTAGPEAFRWTLAGGMQGLGDLAGGPFTSSAAAVSADGSVVVGTGNTEVGQQAFRWTAGSGTVGLGVMPGGLYSVGEAISADGSVVVGSGNIAFTGEAFRWTSSGGMVGISEAAGYTSSASAVSADGSTVVGTTHGGSSNAFRWTQTTGMQVLYNTTLSTSFGAATSADGSVVVGRARTAIGSEEAMIWDATNGMRTVRDVLAPRVGAALDGWQLYNATAVSADGRTIVGYGANPAGGGEAWIAYLADQIYWHPKTSGAWETATNWTGPIFPGPTDDVVLDAPSAITITGPTTNRVVNTLSVGGTGSGRITLRLGGADGGDLRASSYTDFHSNAELVLVDGHTFSTGILFNSGLIRGTGTVSVDLVNYPSGEVRVATGEALVVSGNGHSNDGGRLEAINGSLEFVGPLTNSIAGGRIAARGATLRFQSGLTNNGAMAISTGISDVHGDIANNGTMIVSGHATATFYDDVTNAGTINVATGSTAVFFGELSGSGVGGGGEVFLEGDTSPGFSPGIMAFGGDVHLGPSASLEIELGGMVPGAEHDYLKISGGIDFGGTLDVDLTGGFGPIAGNRFVLATYGSHSGTFAEIDLPPLPSNLSWSLAYNTNELVLTTMTTLLPGDIDLDGDVDRTDAALFARYFGRDESSAWSTGDFNSDGATTLADWTLLQSNLGRTLSSPAATSVPEPSAIVVLLGGIATVAVSAVRRGRRPRMAQR